MTQALLHARVQAEQVGRDRLQHEDFAKTRRCVRELSAAQPEGEVPLARRRFLEQVIDLDDDLERHAGRERVCQAGLRALFPAIEAHQVVREELQVLVRERGVIERGEDGIVQLLDVTSLDFEFGHLQRREQRDEFRQPLAERGKRRGRVIE